MDVVLERLKKMNDFFREANLNYENIFEKLNDNSEFINEEEDLPQTGLFTGTHSLISHEA